MPSVSHDAINITNGTTVFHGEGNWNEVQHGFFVHVMLMVSLMAPLHSLSQDDWNEVQYVFGDVTPLVLAST